MSYGLRRYEAVQRLIWFLFFLTCLAAAYPVSKMHQRASGSLAALPTSFQAGAFKTSALWTQFYWIKLEPLGKVLNYLFWVAVLFLAGRFVWLLVQYLGRYLVQSLLENNIRKAPGRPKGSVEPYAANPERFFPTDLLFQKVNSLPLRLLFHPFQRLRLMLPNPNGALSSEELVEKERRIVETDWQILWDSWTPFRWLLWSLPVLGLVQALWLFYLHLQPALSGQRDVQEVLGPVMSSLIPLAQIIVAVVFFNLISGLLKRLEGLYLSNVDALLYDQFLSKLPFQSSDTLILLEAMQRHFQEVQSMLRRMERLEVEKLPRE